MNIGFDVTEKHKHKITRSSHYLENGYVLDNSIWHISDSLWSVNQLSVIYMQQISNQTAIFIQADVVVNIINH